MQEKILSREGSKTVKSILFNILPTAIGQPVATQFNWCGRNEKFPMKMSELQKIIRGNSFIIDLMTYHVIPFWKPVELTCNGSYFSGATGRNTPSATDAEIDDITKDWLRNFRDREVDSVRTRMKNWTGAVNGSFPSLMANCQIDRGINEISYI